MSIQVESLSFKDNSTLFFKELEKAAESALNAVGGQAVKYAVFKAPTDTGLLKNSLTYALDGEQPKKTKYKADRPKTEGGKIERGSYDGAIPDEGHFKRAVYIGTNVPYAVYQEYGTSGMKKWSGPYLRPAATEHTAEYKAIIKEHLKK